MSRSTKPRDTSVPTSPGAPQVFANFVSVPAFSDGISPPSASRAEYSYLLVLTIRIGSIMFRVRFSSSHTPAVVNIDLK